MNEQNDRWTDPAANQQAMRHDVDRQHVARQRRLRLSALVVSGAAAVGLALWIIVSSLEGPPPSSPPPTISPSDLPTAPTSTTILDQPRDTRIAIGGKKRLSINVFTPTSVKYQWYRLYGATWRPIDKATEATLTVAGTERNNGARYRVRVKSSDKTLISEVARTAVLRPTQTPLADFSRAFGSSDVALQGVDLSRWNHQGDLRALSRADWKFALLKVGGSDRGQRYVDSTYADRLRAARAAGLRVGHYWFNGGGTPRQAAKYFVKHLRDVERGDPIVLDVEPWRSQSGTRHAAWSPEQVHAFLNEVRKQRPSANLFVYMTEQQTWKADWSSVAALSKLWVASWGDNAGVLPSSQPFVAGWNTWQIWQYSSYGRPAGFSNHRVDVNVAKSTAWRTDAE